MSYTYTITDPCNNHITLTNNQSINITSSGSVTSNTGATLQEHSAIDISGNTGIEINNAGKIQGKFFGISFINTTSSIQTLYNTGFIDSSGTNNSQAIIINPSNSIVNLYNYGKINGDNNNNSHDIYNFGLINNLYNSQSNLRLQINFPVNYYIKILNDFSYGTLNSTFPTGTMTFDIDSSSIITPTSQLTYTNVLINIPSNNILFKTGIFQSYSWNIIPDSSNNWDLVFTIREFSPSSDLTTLKDNIYILNDSLRILTNNYDISSSTYFIIPKDYTLNIINNSEIDNYGTIVNYGTINIDSGCAVNNLSGSVFLNEFSGIINNDSSSNSNINSGRFINRGEYNNELGISNFTNNVGGIFKNKNGGTFTNAGTLLNLPGAVFENYYNYLTNNNYGQLINYGEYIPDVQGSIYPSYHIISDGSAHSLAINTISGDLYAWGFNNSGQLGNNTNNQSTVPVKVNTGESIPNPPQNFINNHTYYYDSSMDIILNNGSTPFNIPNNNDISIINNISVNNLILTFSSNGYWDISGTIVTIYGISSNPNINFTNGSFSTSAISNGPITISSTSFSINKLVVTLNSLPSPSNYVNNGNNGNRSITLTSALPYASNFLENQNVLSITNTNPYKLILDSSFTVPVPRPQNYTLPTFNGVLTNIITGSSNTKTFTSTTTSFNLNQLYDYTITSIPSTTSIIKLSPLSITTLTLDGIKYYLAIQINNPGPYVPGEFDYFKGSYIKNTGVSELNNNNTLISDVFVLDFSPNPDYLCFDCSFSSNPNLTNAQDYTIRGITDSSFNLNSSTNDISSNTLGTSPTIELLNNANLSFTSPSILPILYTTSNTLTLDMSVNLLAVTKPSYDGSFNAADFSYNLTFNNTFLNDLSGTKWITIAGGGNTSFGLRDDYSLYSFGDNSGGHLGVGINDTSRNYPTLIPPSVNWIGVSSGLNHALALDYNNHLWSWGDNTYGQLGISNNNNQISPVITHNNISTKIPITDTSNVFIPVDTSFVNVGIVGQNTFGAYGAYGAYAQVFNYPVIQGDKFSFSINSLLGGTGAQNGGAGSYVYINDNSAANLSATNVGLIAVAGGAGGYSTNGVITINGGDAGTTQSNGKGFDGNYNYPGLQGGGGNSNGTGNGGTSYSSLVTGAIGSSYSAGGKGGNGVTQVNGGGGGGGYGGGGGGSDNIYLGGGGGGGSYTSSNGSTSLINTNILAKSSYIQFLSNSSNTPQVSDFACGANHNLAIHLDDGALYSCGNNDRGQLGIFPQTGLSKNTFQNVSTTNVNTGTKWIKVAAGFQHSMGLRDDGSLYAWGDCSYGQLGIGVKGPDASYNTPQLVSSNDFFGNIISGSKWIQIACGYYHSIGLRDNGTLWAWGRGEEGQIGYSGTFTFNKPTLVVGGPNYISCSAGAYHTMGVKIDGNVYTWGLNTNGQLGIGNTNSPILSPTEVSGTLMNPIINI
jgi:alpha-tubulin suppressor-like RCC1 family protein